MCDVKLKKNSTDEETGPAGQLWKILNYSEHWSLYKYCILLVLLK